MAEIATTTRVARVDMTPMVDLGFLLITFFMFTTTFSAPTMMNLITPETNPVSDPPDVTQENSLTLVLGKNDRIFWHQINFDELNIDYLKEVNYGIALRKLILEKRKKAISQDKFTVIIRPTDDANYKNAVDALDEMFITNQKRYVLADITPKEKLVYEAKLKP
jgi:biopolymer transport protein ExbD